MPAQIAFSGDLRLKRNSAVFQLSSVMLVFMFVSLFILIQIVTKTALCKWLFIGCSCNSWWLFFGVCVFCLFVLSCFPFYFSFLLFLVECNFTLFDTLPVFFILPFPICFSSVLAFFPTRNSTFGNIYVFNFYTLHADLLFPK